MIKNFKIYFLFFIDIIVPRFITEDVAMEQIAPGSDWDSFEIACSMSDVQPGEVFDGIATVDSFAWLGLGITYRIGNFRRWGDK